MSRLVMMLLLVIPFTGCTHHQLRFNTVHQASTVGNVHTQQVLDNLAKFVQNPNALPHYSWPNAGATGVNDTLSGTSTFNFNPFQLVGWLFGVSGSRASNESYTMTPINNPQKLELMRCVFQRAVSTCCFDGESGHCPNCQKRLNRFYLGTEDPSMEPRVTEDGKAVYELIKENPSGDQFIEVYEDKDKFGDLRYFDIGSGADMTDDVRLAQAQDKKAEEAKTPNYRKKFRRLQVLGDVLTHTVKTGRITAECLNTPCWFCVGTRRDIPHHIHEHYVGHFGDTYVWVPEDGRDQLTKLTLIVLDIALNESPTARTKEVVAYLDKDQNPSNKANASYRVTAVIPLSASVSSVVPKSAVIAQAAAAQAAAQATALELETAEVQLRQSIARMEESKTRKVFPNLSIQRNSDLPKDLLPLAHDILRAPEQSIEDAEVQKIKVQAADVISKTQQLRELELRAATLSAEAAAADQQSIQMLEPAPTPVPGAGYLQFEQNLRALGTQGPR